MERNNLRNALRDMLNALGPVDANENNAPVPPARGAPVPPAEPPAGLPRDGLHEICVHAPPGVEWEFTIKGNTR